MKDMTERFDADSCSTRRFTDLLAYRFAQPQAFVPAGQLLWNFCGLRNVQTFAARVPGLGSRLMEAIDIARGSVSVTLE
jgi:hypothetical protein